MSFAEFKEAFSEVLGEGLTEEQMSLMFMKIDANRDNYIDWNDFSTYMVNDRCDAIKYCYILMCLNGLAAKSRRSESNEGRSRNRAVRDD